MSAAGLREALYSAVEAANCEYAAKLEHAIESTLIEAGLWDGCDETKADVAAGLRGRLHLRTYKDRPGYCEVVLDNEPRACVHLRVRWE
jgi:hypothetical protein